MAAGWAILFGLASAVSWGAGDFSGGMATRRSPALGVVFVSQWVGGLLLLGLALLLREPLPTWIDLGWGALAGVAGGLSLAALYHGLATQPMGLVAPVASVMTAVVPVTYAALFSGLPGLLPLTGFGLALVGIWLVSQGREAADGETAVTWRLLRLPLLSGLGFGVFLLLIGHVSSSAVLWPLVAARAASIMLLGLWLWRRGALHRPEWSQLPWMAAAGVLDTGGNAFYALAARYGRLDIAAVLSSLYPAATVLLARLVLGERLTPRQWLGAGLALTAVILIAA